MTDIEKALAALAQNEPIEWLLGEVLRSAAAKGEHHLLFDALAGGNPHAVKRWNAWIGEFRNLLVNREMAPQKAKEEISSLKLKFADFMVEVCSVLHLSKRGYSNFEIVLAQGDKKKKTVDFLARRDGKRVRIEVKHLHEPADIIRTVAIARWKERGAAFPDNLNLTISYSYYGPLSDAAISRLNNAIDESPGAALDVYDVKLDENVSIRIQKQITSGTGQLTIESGIGTKHLEFDLQELQRLFTKAFRTTGESVKKFFGRQFDPDAENVIAMRWQLPKTIYDRGTPEAVERAIENAFSAVGLHLKLFIFASDPKPDFKYNS